ATLEDIEPDRPDVEIVMSGDAEDHVPFLIAQHPVDLALDDAVGLARRVHLDAHLDQVPPFVHEDAVLTDPAHRIPPNRLAGAPLPGGSPGGIAAPVAVVSGEAAVTDDPHSTRCPPTRRQSADFAKSAEGSSRGDGVPSTT